MIHRSAPAANAAISQLVDANILVQQSVGRRNRVFEAAEIVSLLDALENELLGVMR